MNNWLGLGRAVAGVIVIHRFKKEIYLVIDRIYEVFNGVPFALNFRRNSLAAGGLDRNFGGKRFYK